MPAAFGFRVWGGRGPKCGEAEGRESNAMLCCCARSRRPGRSVRDEIRAVAAAAAATQAGNRQQAATSLSTLD